MLAPDNIVFDNNITLSVLHEHDIASNSATTNENENDNQNESNSNQRQAISNHINNNNNNKVKKAKKKQKMQSNKYHTIEIDTDDTESVSHSNSNSNLHLDEMDTQTNENAIDAMTPTIGSNMNSNNIVNNISISNRSKKSLKSFPSVTSLDSPNETSMSSTNIDRAAMEELMQSHHDIEQTQVYQNIISNENLISSDDDYVKRQLLTNKLSH